MITAPGRPMENGYIESFNDKFRPEAANRLPISVSASLAITVLMLAGVINVLGFYLR